GRTVGGRAAARVAAATPCRAGRRRAGQRRDCVDPLPLCCRRRGDRRVLVSGSGRHLCAHRYWRNFVRHCDWLVELASAAMGTRAACGNNAVPDDALRRLLGAPTSRWLGCAGHGRVRSLRKLDRAAPDFLGYAAAGHLFLGFAGLPHCRACISAYRLGSSCAAGADTILTDWRIGDGDCFDDADCDRGAFHLGIPGDLYSTLGQLVAGATRSVAAMASAVYNRVYWRPRRSLARRRACNSLRAQQWPAISTPRAYSFCYFRRDRNHACWPWFDALV